MMHLTVSYNSESNQYIAKVYDGPDGIDDAEFNGSCFGEVFEKVIQFVTINGLTYAEDPKDAIRSYFTRIQNWLKFFT